MRRCEHDGGAAARRGAGCLPRVCANGCRQLAPPPTCEVPHSAYGLRGRPLQWQHLEHVVEGAALAAALALALRREGEGERGHGAMRPGGAGVGNAALHCGHRNGCGRRQGGWRCLLRGFRE